MSAALAKLGSARSSFGLEPAHRQPHSSWTSAPWMREVMEQWILDAADLETANDEARLQFLDPHVLPA